jgi:hypothetical protein
LKTAYEQNTALYDAIKRKYKIETIMHDPEITDPLFREAIEAIDSGNVSALESLLNEHPRLVRERLDNPTEGYFQQPYLLWFVADNPIRREKLPANIVEVTSLIISAIQREAVDSFQHQLDYTLGLVATGRIPKECGVQIELIDLLIDAGATVGEGIGALAHGNPAAAEHLIRRGGKLSLATAVCLDRTDDIARLAPTASISDRQVALTAAAFYGKSQMIAFLLQLGADPNAYLDNSSGFHSHATALHQAVSSGSLESVKVLVEAGANLDLRDRIFQGTPLGWAEHMQMEEPDEEAKKRFSAIETYLRNQLTH